MLNTHTGDHDSLQQKVVNSTMQSKKTGCKLISDGSIRMKESIIIDNENVSRYLDS